MVEWKVVVNGRGREGEGELSIDVMCPAERRSLVAPLIKRWLQMISRAIE